MRKRARHLSKVPEAMQETTGTRLEETYATWQGLQVLRSIPAPFTELNANEHHYGTCTTSPTRMKHRADFD